MPRSRRHSEIDPALADAVRAALVLPPDDEVAERHLQAMAAVDPVPDPQTAPQRARGSRGRARPSLLPRPVLRGAGVLLASVAGLGGATTGLALAGVDLPRAAVAPFEAVGVELPNQPETEQADERPVREREPARQAPAVTRPEPAPARTDGERPARERPSAPGDRRERQDDAPPASRPDPAPRRGEDNGRRPGGSDRGTTPPRPRTDPPAATPPAREDAPGQAKPEPRPAPAEPRGQAAPQQAPPVERPRQEPRGPNAPQVPGEQASP